MALPYNQIHGPSSQSSSIFFQSQYFQIVSRRSLRHFWVFFYAALLMFQLSSSSSCQTLLTFGQTVARRRRGRGRLRVVWRKPTVYIHLPLINGSFNSSYSALFCPGFFMFSIDFITKSRDRLFDHPWHCLQPRNFWFAYGRKVYCATVRQPDGISNQFLLKKTIFRLAL